MRMNKKKLLSLALVIVLIAILSFGTLAWFSDADEVTNTFLVTNSQAEPNKIFSVDVWEYVDGNTQVKDHDGHTFENILPGGTYKKQPYVENTGSYDQYVRVHVTVSNAQAWKEILGNDYNLSEILLGYDHTAWTMDGEGKTNSDDTYTMTFYLNYKLTPGEKASLFDTVVIPSKLTQNDMAKLDGKFELTILAEAVQTENVGDNAKAAFATVMADQDIDQIQ